MPIPSFFLGGFGEGSISLGLVFSGALSEVTCAKKDTHAHVQERDHVSCIDSHKRRKKNKRYVCIYSKCKIQVRRNDNVLPIIVTVQDKIRGGGGHPKKNGRRDL